MKNIPELKNVYINEDLTKTRSNIFFLARQLLKKEKIAQLWTTNGKIMIKDYEGTIYNVSNKNTFSFVAKDLDPAFVFPHDY